MGDVCLGDKIRCITRFLVTGDVDGVPFVVTAVFFDFLLVVPWSILVVLVAVCVDLLVVVYGVFVLGVP